MYPTKSRQEAQKAGTEAVRRLRQKKLSSGQPFMINSRHLPKGQCYLEFPDGHITLVSLTTTRRDFHILKEFSGYESINIRRQFHLTH